MEQPHPPPSPTLMCVCGLVGFGSQWHSNDYAFSSSRKYQWAKRTPPTRAFGKTANKNNTESGRMNTSRGPYAVRFADFRAAAFQSECLMPRIFSIHGASCCRRGLFSCDPASGQLWRRLLGLINGRRKRLDLDLLCAGCSQCIANNFRDGIQRLASPE